MGRLLLFIFTFADMGVLFLKDYLSEGVAASRDHSVEIEYERFGRVLSNMDMKVIISGSVFTEVFLFLSIIRHLHNH